MPHWGVWEAGRLGACGGCLTSLGARSGSRHRRAKWLRGSEVFVLDHVSEAAEGPVLGHADVACRDAEGFGGFGGGEADRDAQGEDLLLDPRQRSQQAAEAGAEVE